MANTLTTIMPKILARGLIVLRERCIMPRLVNGDYALDAKKKGSTIDVEVPTTVGTRDVSPSNTPPTSVDHTADTVQIELSNWRQNDPIYLTDKDYGEIEARAGHLPMKLQEAIKGLASDVNQSIHAKYKGALRGVFGVTGTAGTTPFGSTTTATQARKILNKQLCPKSDRRGVLDFDAEAAALELAAFADAEKIASSVVKIEGDIGRKFGLDWAADDEVTTHTAGTIAATGAPSGRVCAAVGAGVVGDTTVDVDNGASTAVTGTIVLGDIVSFAGHSQTYVVIANAASGQYAAEAYTFAANAVSGLAIYPALKAAVADNEVMTVVATHVVNLAFHRDAFAFAQRPLLDPGKELGLAGTNIMTMQDPQTGIILRLEVSRQHKQVAWEFDLLWGAELVRPELACRILG